jgi:predicted RNase H-like HicB family nuclease
MRLTVVLIPEAEGGYSVICPAIPGCASQGETLDKALASVKEAIQLCLAVRAEDSIPLPNETPELIARQIENCLNDRKEEGLPLTLETREVEVAAEVAV